MKDNKNQPANTLVNESFEFTSSLVPSTQLARVVPLNNRYDASKLSPGQSPNDTKVIRRYSFDDNGGGYQGL